MSKVPVNYDQLCGLADHARRVGTLDVFADVALQWAWQADKEIVRLRGLLCKCDMRTRLVGDGCEFCNPQLADELAKEQR